AGIYNLPVIFVCENNLYSSHMGIAQRRRKDNIVDSAGAHGISGHRVDGNDLEAVVKVMADVVANARNGEGPALLELRTFRWRGHVGPKWDEDVGVKRKDELREWLPRDPIARVATTLIERGHASSELDLVSAEARQQVERAMEFARRSPYPTPGSVTKHIYRSAS
ncbi:MAG: hypothetical protein FJ267_07235, partial [Planctomycetes bacterium]|nr:hypothetical protein [Planctomycetota bacterium]